MVVILIIVGGLLTSLAGSLIFFKRQHYKQLHTLEMVLDQVIQQNFSSQSLAYQEGYDAKLIYKAKRIAEMNQDYREQVLNEQERTKGTIADMSHQLKTPVASLAMYLELLQESTLTQQQQTEFLERMVVNTDRLCWLTDEFLNIARFETNTITLNQQIVGLKQTLQQAILENLPAASKKKLAIQLQIEADFSIRYDQKWLTEAFTNIIENAVKYAFEGTNIQIQVNQLIAYTRIQIENQGPPIPPVELPKIFKKYYRGTNGQLYEGAGIGLYLAKLIVESHGGYVVADSRNEQTIISIFLQN
ncbi:sensor histidine kinase [Enterococcus sp. AZ103]|uniref:sensor histidine kinase n=1 Tax=Enterococcus sp. AZ103 TaxID=2774628 RepID=UPI003F266EC7